MVDSIKIPEVVLIVDTETTGLDPQHGDKVLELGAVLYSLKHQSVEAIASATVPWTEMEVPDNPAERINRIPIALVHQASNIVWKHIEDTFRAMVQKAQAILAHSAKFDHDFLTESKEWLYWDSRPWLCTKTDFRWKRAGRMNLSLRDLALEYGVGVMAAHRAISDCLLIAEIMNRMTSDELREEFALALRPKFEYKADIKFEENQLAKDAGFQFDRERKAWVRKMSEGDTALLPFKVSRTKASLRSA